MVDIHMVIGKIPFKPKKGFVLPRHRFTGPYNPLHLQLDTKDNPLPKNGFVLPRHRFTGTYNPLPLQLDSKDNPLPGSEPYNAVDAISILFSLWVFFSRIKIQSRGLAEKLSQNHGLF